MMVVSAFAYNITWFYNWALLIGLAGNILANKWNAFRIGNDSNASKITTNGISLPHNFGMFLGSAIVGFLALPTLQYQNIVDKNIVFIFILPNLFIALLCLISFKPSFCLLHPKKQDYKNSNVHGLSNVENTEKNKTSIQWTPLAIS